MENSKDDVKNESSLDALSIPNKQWLSSSRKKIQQWLSSSKPETMLKDTDVDSSKDDNRLKPDSGLLRKTVSCDIPDRDKSMKIGSLSSSFKRSIIKKRPYKRFERPEPKYGHDTAEYEAIRERVLQERAVVNAIEALLERGRMLMYLNDDCVDLNQGRIERQYRRLSIQRQYELIVVLSVFTLTCLPITVLMVFICRLL